MMRILKPEDLTRRRLRILPALFVSLVVAQPASSQGSLVQAAQVTGGGTRMVGNLAIRATVGSTVLSGIEFVAISTEDQTEGGTIPRAYALESNYPNPFRGTTVVAYSVSESGVVRIDVVDPLGRIVDRLVDRPHPAGRFTARLDGSRLTPGLYFLRLEVGGHRDIRPIVHIE